MCLIISEWRSFSMNVQTFNFMFWHFYSQYTLLCKQWKWKNCWLLIMNLYFVVDGFQMMMMRIIIKCESNLVMIKVSHAIFGFTWMFFLQFSDWDWSIDQIVDKEMSKLYFYSCVFEFADGSDIAWKFLFLFNKLLYFIN